MENGKINEPHKFVINLLQKLDFRSLNKNVALQNLSVYHTRENIMQRDRNDKLKIITPMWNDEF